MKKNTTGLPDNLKSGIETLSCHSMNDVQVHYNCAVPAQLESHSYSEGTDIDPDQEKVPDEKWHIVQQKEVSIKLTLPAKLS